MKATIAITAITCLTFSSRLQSGYACESDVDCSCINGLCIDSDHVVCGTINDLVCDASSNNQQCHCDMYTKRCRNYHDDEDDDNDRRIDNTPSPEADDCPDEWTETQYEAFDIVSVDGLVYQCTSARSCGQYGYNPESTVTIAWSRAWTLIGYCNVGEESPQPSSAPPTTPALITAVPTTNSPSSKPTTDFPTTAQPTSLPPTLSPSGSPTCEATADADVCIAVDMSGSICNKASQQQQCNGCSPHNSCGDSFIQEDTCCVNFADVEVFASTLVSRLDEKMTGSDNFSLVQFATDASVQSDLTSAQALQSKLFEMVYSGGKTNTQAALTSCQSTLASSNKKKYIILVTDGVPTTSDRTGAPFSAALAAANEVKEDEIFIITTFIDSINDDSGKELMMEISSGDSLYDVTDFDDLDTIVDAVADPVLCSKDNNTDRRSSTFAPTAAPDDNATPSPSQGKSGKSTYAPTATSNDVTPSPSQGKSGKSTYAPTAVPDDNATPSLNQGKSGKSTYAPTATSNNVMPSPSQGKSGKSTYAPTAAPDDNVTPSPSQGKSGKSTYAPTATSNDVTPSPSQGKSGKSTYAPTATSNDGTPSPSQGKSGKSTYAPTAAPDDNATPSPSQGKSGKSTYAPTATSNNMTSSPSQGKSGKST